MEILDPKRAECAGFRHKNCRSRREKITAGAEQKKQTAAAEAEAEAEAEEQGRQTLSETVVEEREQRQVGSVHCAVEDGVLPVGGAGERRQPYDLDAK